MTNVTLLYFEGCPNWQVADERLGFVGSPTLLIEGEDPFATGEEPSGLACRVYDTPDGPQGSPTLAQLRAVLA